MFFYSQTWNKVKFNCKTCNEAYLCKKNKIFLFLNLLQSHSEERGGGGGGGKKKK